MGEAGPGSAVTSRPQKRYLVRQIIKRQASIDKRKARIAKAQAVKSRNRTKPKREEKHFPGTPFSKPLWRI